MAQDPRPIMRRVVLASRSDFCCQLARAAAAAPVATTLGCVHEMHAMGMVEHSGTKSMKADRQLDAIASEGQATLHVRVSCERPAWRQGRTRLKID